jgi:GH25 family lysozyme M1 (1,4-beta-N-acetylmuramidase)
MPDADPSKGQMEGVDSSHWQGTIFPKVGVEKFNIKWWAIKATEGTSYVDPTFRRARQSIRDVAGKNGILYCPIYHFPRNNLSIEAQVDHFIRTVGPLEVGECAKLDDEAAVSLGAPLTINQAALWHRLIEEYYGRPTCQYTGAFVKHERDPFYHWDSLDLRNSTIKDERPNILASYNSWSNVTTRGKPVHVWQWTSKAIMPGLHSGGDNVGRIDRDLVLVPHAYDLACGYVDQPQPIPPTPPIPVPTPGDTMSRVLFRLTDSDAAFFAWVDAQGIALQVEWTGSGDDPNAVARINAQMAAGCEVKTIAIENLMGVSLVGPLPHGDPKHDWTGMEFGMILGNTV